MQTPQNGHDQAKTLVWTRTCPRCGATLRKTDAQRVVVCQCEWEWAA
jgi:hypothetical protein